MCRFNAPRQRFDERRIVHRDVEIGENSALWFDARDPFEREIKMGAATEMERATSIPMTVMIRGDFAGVFAALSEIETMDRLIRVRRLKIGNDNGRARELVRDGVVTATLTMDVFYGPRDEAGPDKSKGKRS